MREALPQRILQSVYDQVANRYDRQHAFVTAGSDEDARRLLVEKAVQSGDWVLDAGAGTGSTAFLAARKAGSEGKVILLDLSRGMLATSRKNARRLRLQNHADFLNADMVRLPFNDNCFDVVLSTYSLDPVGDPTKAALELYRVVKLGGRVAIAHTTDPENQLLRRLARKVEGVVWQFPLLSLGCRPVSVLPALEQMGGKLLFKKKIGIPLWPFLVFVIEKTRP